MGSEGICKYILDIITSYIHLRMSLFVKHADGQLRGEGVGFSPAFFVCLSVCLSVYPLDISKTTA